MIAVVREWIKQNWDFLHNSGSLIGTMLVTSGSGFVYWWLAARAFSPEAVGLASAAISAMTLLGTIGILGLGTLLIGELQRQYAQRIAIITNALVIVGIAGGLLGLLFALIVPLFLKDFHILNTNAGSIALFSAGVSLTSVALVLDQAMIGLLQGKQQLVRNTLFALIKLGALFAVVLFLTNRNGLTIYATWTLGNVLSIAYLGWLFLRKGYRFSAYRTDWAVLKRLGRPAISHHLLNLSLQAPSMLLPVIVTAMLSSRMNAYFYTSWMIASFAFYGPVALTTVLFAVGASNPARLSEKMRMTLNLSVIIGLLANLVIFAGAHLALGLFNPTYAAEASWCLRLLGLGFFPLIIKNHYVAHCRIQNLLLKAVYITGLGALAELVLATIGAALGGLTGLSLGWLAGLCLETIFMAPTVYRAVNPAKGQVVTDVQTLPDQEQAQQELQHL